MSINKTSFFITVISVFLFACASNRDKITEKILQGTIYITGNEPFTQPAVKDTEGEVYLLSCSKDMEKEIRKLQGDRIRLFCSQIVKRKNRNEATVVRFEIMNER